MAANPNMHWSDVMIKADNTTTVDLKNVIQAKLSAIYAEQIAKTKSEQMRATTPGSPTKTLQGLESV